MEKLTNKQKLEAERKELNLLISKGVGFELECITYEKRKFLGSLRKKTKVKKTLDFRIEEPTLSTLDRISAEQVDLAIDEKLLASPEALTEAKNLTSKYARKLARIIAIAVIGQANNDRKLEELTDLFFNNIKPSKLHQVAILINTMSNLGDFCNSIRLMSANRTTMPIRIEENKEG